MWKINMNKKLSLNILLVDDTAFNIEILEEHLQSLGYKSKINTY